MTFIAYLNVLMVTRLWSALWPPRRRSGVVLIPLLVQLLALGLFEPTPAVLGVAASVVAFQLPALWRWSAARSPSWAEPEPRLLPLLGTALCSSFFFPHIALDPAVVEWVTSVAHRSVMLESWSPESWRTFNVYALGLLLLTNEVNLVIRKVLHWVSREPTPSVLQQTDAGPGKTQADAEAEYDAGRVIGIVERYLMFAVLQFSDNYEALPFILAAKGFARFKQMEQRTYAEYVLIGTLASTLSAIAVFEFVSGLVK